MDVRNSFSLNIEFWNTLANQNLNISLHVYASTGECIFNISTPVIHCEIGIIQAKTEIPANFMNDGSYLISFMIVKDKSIVLHNFEEVFNFEIADHRVDTTWYGKWPGYVRPNFDFPITQISNSI
jgi:lipopolysaccharide transport system ATP-binding protein